MLNFGKTCLLPPVIRCSGKLTQMLTRVNIIYLNPFYLFFNFWAANMFSGILAQTLTRVNIIYIKGTTE